MIPYIYSPTVSHRSPHQTPLPQGIMTKPKIQDTSLGQSANPNKKKLLSSSYD